MNRHEIQLLQQIEGYPSLTITLPTHRTAPENQQDAIRLKNLAEQAVARLLTEFNKREIAPLIGRLDELISSIDIRYLQDGLVLFVNRDFGRAVYLPFVLKERVTVGKTFYTRDLVFAMNRTPRYWVLVLSEKPTRLYEATRDTLIEIQEGGFPIMHTGPGGEEPLPGGFGIRKSAYRDEYHRKFFRQVDANLKPFLADDPLPIVVTGVTRFLAFFSEVSSCQDSVMATLRGNYDKLSPYELSQKIWPVAEKAFARQRQQIMVELDRAVKERKYVSTVGEVWRLAKEGRGRLLLVEQDFHFPAQVDETGMHLLPAGEADAAQTMDDAVDEIVESVLNQRGRVVFVDNGQLKAHQRIALILRY